MTPLNPIENLFAVEVPEGRDFSFTIDCNNQYETDKFCTISMLAKDKSAHRFIELPYGSYEILFTTSDVTEEKLEQAGIATKWLFLDILSSNNLDPNKNYLLIKRNEQ